MPHSYKLGVRDFLALPGGHNTLYTVFIKKKKKFCIKGILKICRKQALAFHQQLTVKQTEMAPEYSFHSPSEPLTGLWGGRALENPFQGMLAAFTCKMFILFIWKVLYY